MAISATPQTTTSSPSITPEKTDHDPPQHVETTSPPASDLAPPSDGKLSKETVLAFIASLPHSFSTSSPPPSEFSNQETNKDSLQKQALCGQINAYVMTMLIPSTTLPYIAADLGPSANATWITVVWTLGAAVLVSVGGRLSDIFGRRYFMMTGALVSIAGTLVGANARSVEHMILSGALFGVGSGFQELCYACVQECVPNRLRVVAVGGLDVSLALAFSSPLVSYAFIAHQNIGWRGAYWYLFAFHCFAFALLFLFYRPPDFAMKHRADGKTKMRLLAQLDYVGVVLFLAGGVLFLLGINFGGRTYPWRHTGTIAPIVVGICCFVAVGVWDAYADLEYPLFPPKLFKRVREFDMVMVVCFVGGMLYYSMNVLWPRQSQAFFVGPEETIMRGVYATIFSCGTWAAGLITVFVCSRLHHEKWQLVGFTVVQTALIGSMASVGSGDRAQAIVTVVVTAITITPPQLLSFTMLSFGLEDQTDLGVAVGLAGTFRLFGGAVATTIYTAIYSTRTAEVLPGEMRSAIRASGVDFSEGLLAGLVAAAQTNTAATYASVAGVTPRLAGLAVEATKQSYVAGFRLVYLVAIGFGVAATVAAMCTVSTDRAKKNNERAIIMKNEVGKEAVVSKTV